MDMDHGKPEKQGGFTIIEMTIVMAVLLPMLLGITTTTLSVNSTMEANSRASDVLTYGRRMSQRVARLVRPAKLATIKARAVKLDVLAGRATAIGEWISPAYGIQTSGIEFKSATGILSVNAALSSSTRRIVFDIEKGETKNGKDDDGDGLIDEGEVRLLQDGSTVSVMRGVEKCSFALYGRVLWVRLRVARRASDGRVFRNELLKRYYVRNN